MASYIYNNSRHSNYQRENDAIQAVAVVALDRYGLQEAHLTPVESDEDGRRVYQIEVRSGSSAVHPYLGRLERHKLMLHLFAADSASFIRAELTRLAAMLRDTGLVAPEPVPAGDGSLVLTIGGGDSPLLHCVLMRSTQPHHSELSLSGAVSVA